MVFLFLRWAEPFGKIKTFTFGWWWSLLLCSIQMSWCKPVKNYYTVGNFIILCVALLNVHAVLCLGMGDSA